MFSINGIFSGLDVNTMVDSLVEAERAPIEARYSRQELAYDIELSALGLLKSAMGTFESRIDNLNNASDLSPRSGSVSNEDALSASVSSAAVPGSYQFYVDQLASRHQMASEGFASDATFGTGTISFEIDANAFSISIPEGADSLGDIRDAINSAEDNTGVQAAIINDGDQQRLLLTSKETGALNTIEADFSGLTGGTAVFSEFTNLQTASDARIRFGSGNSAILITSSGNTLENIIDGVSLDLKAVSTEPVTLVVSHDKNNVKNSIQSFVDAYNELKSAFNTLTRFDGESAGPLTGDAQTRGIENQLRAEISALFGEDGDSFRTLGDLGIKTTRDGMLEIDDTKLDEVLNNNFDGLAEIFTGESGVMNRLKETLNPYLGSDGSITSRENRISEGLDDLADDRADLEARLERVRNYYQNQFLAMENLLASLNSTSQWLTNNLNSLNNNNDQ